MDEDDEEDNLFTAHSNAQESYLDENENEPSVTATSHRRVVAFADENQDDNVEYADENTHVGGAFGHSDEVDADLGDDTLHSDLELEAEEDDELESSDDEDDEDDVDVVHGKHTRQAGYQSTLPAEAHCFLPRASVLNPRSRGPPAS